MARGFESKDVEYQQSESSKTIDRRPALSPAEREAADRRRTLELTRTRMLTELQSASAPAHRQTLEAALAAIDAELSSPRG